VNANGRVDPVSSSSPPISSAVGRGAGVMALPNLLSLFRIAIVPGIVLLLMSPGPVPRGIAGGLFVVASITDYLDGWLARRRKSTTVLGQFLDPLADKLLVAAVLIMLVGAPLEPRVPAWMAVVLVLREFAVTGLRAVASQSGLVMPAQELGKYKMIFQIFALTGLLVHYRYTIPLTHFVVDFHAAGMRFLWIALVVAIWSAVDYYVHVFRRLRLE
jgi:CDP-diacylglycerol--glycerol-3-phosphate 3-phosphatidyltransferase